MRMDSYVFSEIRMDPSAPRQTGCEVTPAQPGEAGTHVSGGEHPQGAAGGRFVTAGSWGAGRKGRQWLPPAALTSVGSGVLCVDCAPNSQQPVDGPLTSVLDPSPRARDCFLPLTFPSPQTLLRQFPETQSSFASGCCESRPRDQDRTPRLGGQAGGTGTGGHLHGEPAATTPASEFRAQPRKACDLCGLRQDEPAGPALPPRQARGPVSRDALPDRPKVLSQEARLTLAFMGPEPRP